MPVGEPVHLTVTAPDWDVIHSWWIPALGGKIDAIPGRINHTWFTATKAGVYTGRCAELCGVQHAEMLMSVEATAARRVREVGRAAGRAAASGTAKDSLGQEEWSGACAKCHGLAGQGLVGPQIAPRERSRTRPH